MYSDYSMTVSYICSSGQNNCTCIIREDVYSMTLLKRLTVVCQGQGHVVDILISAVMLDIPVQHEKQKHEKGTNTHYLHGVQS